MFPWSFSWLPSLPSIDLSLPSGIQKRFISFALRQTLGHFLKPGQLDVQQVDSQIGSGYVQVRDLELNDEAINALISGLPVRLRDGSVGKVTARIPWPNPLTSTVGLSLESLHLTFDLEPTVASPTERPFVENLAESVASVAESFIHEELTAREEATLRESFHPELRKTEDSQEDSLPGGLDPFISEEDVHQHDSDPPGVSIFATLIERLLARFQFDATDTRITIVNPQDASFTLIIPDIHYSTDTQHSLSTPVTSDSEAGEVRKVVVAGIAVTSRCLRPLRHRPITGFEARPGSVSSSPPTPSRVPSPISSNPTETGAREVSHEAMNRISPSISSIPGRTPSPVIEPPSPPSDSSDMDEETQMFMSQSIASLPPRPASPVSSVSSSMYQSAISSASPETVLDDVPEESPIEETSHSRSQTPSPPYPPSPISVTPEAVHSVPAESVDNSSARPACVPSLVSSPFRRRFGLHVGDVEDETVLSLGTESLEIRLITPATRAYKATPATPSQPNSEAAACSAKGKSQNQQGHLRLEVTMGTIACAFSARQIRSLLDLTEVWTSHDPPAPPSRPFDSRASTTSPIPLEDLEGSLRVRGIVILLLSPLRTSASNPDDALTEYFARPLTPLSLSTGYTRLHIDGISSSLSVRRSVSTNAKRSTARREPPSTSGSLVVSDISCFAFVPRFDVAGELHAYPVLITDPHLTAQYSEGHEHPSLDSAVGPGLSLPTFEIVDWTSPRQTSTSTKLSTWRTKAAHAGRPPSQVAQNELPQSSPFARSPLRRVSELAEPSSPPVTHPIPMVLPQSPGRLGLTGLSPSPVKDGTGMPKTSSPAVSVKFRDSSSAGREPQGAADIQITLTPLHVFLDFAALLGPSSNGKSEALRFIDELFAPSSSYDPNNTSIPTVEDFGADSDPDFSPGTPRPTHSPTFRESDAERERRRLEQLVLEDLDLGFDYRQPGLRQSTRDSEARGVRRKHKAKIPDTNISINIPVVRVEVRVPPPAHRSPRSGARPTSARFGTSEDVYGGETGHYTSRQGRHTLLGATWRRIVVAHSLAGESKARAILSMGPLGTRGIDQKSSLGIGTPPGRDVPSESLLPRLVITRSPVIADSLITVNSTAISLEIPSVYVALSKPILDGLQLWADDLTQCMEAAFSEPALSDGGTEKAGSGASSLIGSRYFARTSSLGSATDSGATSLAGTVKPRPETRGETAVKISTTEVPRAEAGNVVYPFDVAVSDVDVLLELKPEGKDETVVTLGVMDIKVHDATPAGRNCSLSLTTPRSLKTTLKPALKLRFTSLVVPETTAKETRIRLTLCGVTYHFYPGLEWSANLARFFKAPPGAFESVVPSERTKVNLKILDTSIRLLAPSHPGAIVPYIGEFDLTTVLEGNSPSTTMNLSVPTLALLLIDDLSSSPDESDESSRGQSTIPGVAYWKCAQSAGYALLAEVSDLILSFNKIDGVNSPDSRLLVDQGDLRLHICADTMGVLAAFISDFTSAFKQPGQNPPEPKRRSEPANVSERPTDSRGLLASLDDHAFRRLPEVGAAPDMIEDDLPTNPDYLDESFGAAAGLRELSDDEFEDSDVDASYTPAGEEDSRGITSSYGGETIRILRPGGIDVIENYFDTLPQDPRDSSHGETVFRVRVHDLNATVFLYDGYDWVRTRNVIEEKAKEMRRRLAKIRQLVASGQTPDPSVEETNAILFNSVYIGLQHNVDELEPAALIAAIDEELNEDFETTTQSSWQSLKPQPLASPGRGGAHSSKAHRRRLRRAKGPSIEFRLTGLDAEVDQYRPDASLVSRILATVRDVEILDHIKTSTWKKFLTSLQTDSRGNVRESDSNMVRVELRTLHPVPGHPSEEARLRAKILPLRLHVDQDALDFLKQFFSFKDPDAASSTPSGPSNEIYFQQAEVFPIDIKLDYKPRRVDYRALREGRTIELMNFFHFDGAEMTLRHITVNGITGWPRFFDLLNDLWTPDVKATQLVDVISGVAPIRSVVNVGSGVADLILLPIAQYKKDGRLVRGLQKGTNSFVKSTAMEAIRLGARLATGTQVILEQAETVLGGQFKDEVMAEALQIPFVDEDEESREGDGEELISKYADQPTNMKEGVKSAYSSLKRNLNSAAQTILAVPMEVYERSGNEGPVRAVVRAVPIAVLKPMIGASEAVSKTLLGLQNTLDPNIRRENEDKYKRR
ncbi:hypothetical protein BN946_scf184799.g5 [Trametes cinnabarina]|uniref:Autophagy-related protein 2 n=1 Tax=Pycnoporus cinnabarinus TaxID=5643 RepID=A0A060S7C1_PYCCI|nr:hypothetical protein BN946_scf184799.g5 [Trametes cinnabarina]